MLRDLATANRPVAACHHGSVEETQLRWVLEVVDCAVWAGVLLPEHLPSIATHLLADGADTPALRWLAGMDLAPFDPRDARASLLDVLAETATPERSRFERVEAAAYAVSVATTSSLLSTGDALRRFSRLAVANEYPDHDEVMRLYGLLDEWVGGWGRSHAAIETEVSGLLAAIASRHDPVPSVVVEAVARS